MAFETQVEAGTATARRENGENIATRAGGSRVLLAMAGATFVLQVLLGLNSHTSWLLTVAEHWLAGSRIYADILEPSPPGSFLSLVPAIIVSRLTMLPPEPIVTGLVALAGLAITEATTRMTIVAGVVDSPARLRLTLGFTLLVLPLSIFAEPEHLAVMALVPLWATMAVRAEARRVPLTLLLLAGIGAGLAICFKPQFAAAILLPALAVARRQRNFAFLFLPEYLVAALVAALFAGAVALAFPDYIATMVPLASELYRPVREPIVVLLASPVVAWTILALIGLWLVGRDKMLEPPVAVRLLAGLGCFFVMIEQGKGLQQDTYPIVAALMPALVDRGMAFANSHFAKGTQLSRRLIGVFGFLFIALGVGFATLSFHVNANPAAALVAPIKALAPHPRLVAISPSLSVGHPLTRLVGGTWVGSVANEWITLGALYRLGLKPRPEAERKRLEAVIEADRARMARDIASGKADIVIVEHDDLVFPAWFASDAELVDYLRGYSRRSTVEGIFEIWTRDG